MDHASSMNKIMDGRTDMIIDFLKSGGQARSKTKEGIPLIRVAAYYGDVSAVKVLIEAGENLSTLGKNYDLNGASFHGHWRLVQFLIEQGANPNKALKDSGEYPLHVALSKANSPFSLPVIKVLLDSGADPNVHTHPSSESGCFMRDARTFQETPLHRAAAFANDEVISLLLNYGADKTARDCNENSPLSWASWHLRPGNILALLTYGPHRIGDAHIRNLKSDHGFGLGGGLMTGLIGNPHSRKGSI